LDSCAASLSALKTGVAHPQTISPAIISITMATNTLSFACLRQQCPYRAKSLAHMQSHIMHEHKVKPWECAEANCGMKYARK
jgi:hypothetical protein